MSLRKIIAIIAAGPDTIVKSLKSNIQQKICTSKAQVVENKKHVRKKVIKHWPKIIAILHHEVAHKIILSGNNQNSQPVAVEHGGKKRRIVSMLQSTKNMYSQNLAIEVKTCGWGKAKLDTKALVYGAF